MNAAAAFFKSAQLVIGINVLKSRSVFPDKNASDLWIGGSTRSFNQSCFGLKPWNCGETVP